MSITDRLAARVARPATHALDAPIRDLVQAILREHGYASPAEVQALRDEVRDARGRLDTLDGRLAALAKVEPRVADPRVSELEAKIEALEAQLRELSARPLATVTPPAAPLHAEPAGDCKVGGCDGKVRSKGFCSAHYQQWRRGSLPGFVGPEGLVAHDGRVLHVDVAHAGHAVTVVGNTVSVDGKPIPTHLGR